MNYTLNPTQIPGVFVAVERKIKRKRAYMEFEKTHKRYCFKHTERALYIIKRSSIIPKKLTKNHPEIYTVALYKDEVHADTLLSIWHNMKHNGWMLNDTIDAIAESFENYHATDTSDTDDLPF